MLSVCTSPRKVLSFQARLNSHCWARMGQDICWLEESTPPFQGYVKLPKDTTIMFPQEAEKLVWGCISKGTPSSGCKMLAKPLLDHDMEWRQGRALVTTFGGYVHIQMCNPTLYQNNRIYIIAIAFTYHCCQKKDTLIKYSSVHCW